MSLRLAIFDLDGTLKQTRDPYVYLHQALGTWEASLAFHEQGLSGEIDYDEWLRRDAALWKGIAQDRMEAVFRSNGYLPGAQETVTALQRAGVKVALVSTGLLVHAQQVQAELNLDRIVANEIFFEGGCATGLARTHIREGGKGPVVEKLQAEFGVQPEECLAVGDSLSDVAMFGRARVGVAINPSSDQVRNSAHLVLEEPDMRPLLTKLHQFAPGWVPTMDIMGPSDT